MSNGHHSATRWRLRDYYADANLYTIANTHIYFYTDAYSYTNQHTDANPHAYGNKYTDRSGGSIGCGPL